MLLFFNCIHFMKPSQIISTINQANRFLKPGGRAFFIFEQPFSLDFKKEFVIPCVKVIDLINDMSKDKHLLESNRFMKLREVLEAYNLNSFNELRKKFISSPMIQKYFRVLPLFSIYEYQKRKKMIFSGYSNAKTGLYVDSFVTAIQKIEYKPVSKIFTHVELDKFKIISKNFEFKEIKSLEFSMYKNTENESSTKILENDLKQSGHYSFAGCVLEKTEKKVVNEKIEFWIKRAKEEEDYSIKIQKNTKIVPIIPAKYPFFKVVKK